MVPTLANNRVANNYICSPMNYIGGKYKLLPQIIPSFPQKISTFVDLFCGGANVGINVNAKRFLFNDNIKPLIDLYRCLQELPLEQTLSYIQERVEEFQLSLTNADGYLSLRQEYNQNRNPLDLFILTAFSFNHQIRFNSALEFNNPFGKERSCFNPRMKSNLIRFINVLKTKEIVFESRNFEQVDLSCLTQDDFVYCDPPYLITTGTYNDGKRGFTGWNECEERKLLNLLSQLNDRNILFALSNVICHKGKTNHLLKSWIDNNSFNVIHLTKDYSNSNYHTLDRSKESTDEVLVMNYIPETRQLTFEDALYWQ